MHFVALLSRIACICAPRSLRLYSPCSFFQSVALIYISFRLALLQKFRMGQFVTADERRAFLADCPVKWHPLFQTSLSLHHLHACFKIYDSISVETLKLRMECSEDECFKCMERLLAAALATHAAADLLDCNRTNERNPSAMIPSTIDQVKVCGAACCYSLLF
jgi:hypothetical protein